MNKPCDYFERLISDAADSSLTSAQQKELGAHLATCAHCREFQTSVQRSSGFLKHLPGAELNIPLPPAVSAPDRLNPLQRVWRSHISLPAPLAAAAVLIIVGLSLWIATRQRAEPVMQLSQPTAAINYVQVEQIAPGSGTLISAPKKP